MEPYLNCGISKWHWISSLHYMKMKIEIFWPKKSWSVKQLGGRLSLRVDGDSDWFNIAGKQGDGQAMHFNELLQNLSEMDHM